MISFLYILERIKFDYITSIPMKNTYSYKDIFENFSTFFLFLCGFF